MIKYYKNNSGSIAKLMDCKTNIIIMFEHKTFFADNMVIASAILNMYGFH